MRIFSGVRCLKNRFILVMLIGLIAPVSANAGDRQLVMFSTEGCVYCQIFKRDVAPRYRWSRAARKAPIVEVDIERRGTGGYSLRSGITVTPTFVMFKRGREVARIPGYPGEKNFYKMVNQIIKKAK